jgi:hypothetical protein
MTGRILSSLIVLSLLTGTVLSQNLSLSHLYRPGTTLIDSDGDGFTDRIELSLIISDRPTSEEIALASEIAARINLESLNLNFGLVSKESEIGQFSRLKNPVLIGSNLKLSQAILAQEKIDLQSFSPNQGLIIVFNYQGQQGFLVVAGSQETLLRTGRAFFLRWPYFWEIWGRESGFTWEKTENDLEKFLISESISVEKKILRKALYEFPPQKNIPPILKSLNFEAAGEIASLTVDMYFSSRTELEKAATSLKKLARLRDRGEGTEILAYPACRQLHIRLISNQKEENLVLPRPGSSKRLLTPAFKEIPRAPEKPRQFDLTELFSIKGFYVDRNQDGIMDGLETAVIVPEGLILKRLPLLTTRLVLDPAGGSFPLVYFDSEIESKKSLLAPILLGQNSLVLELKKSGKLQTPFLEPHLGMIKLVPGGLSHSDCLVIDSPTATALEKTLEYFSLKFPYLTEFKKGEPELSWLKEDLERFLKGELGAAEAYFQNKLTEELSKLENQNLENLELKIILPEKNDLYRQELESLLKERFNFPARISLFSLNDPVEVFSGQRQLEWEVDEALKLVEEVLNQASSGSSLKISLGLSEPLAVRLNLKGKIEELLTSRGLKAKVEVLSAYKQGFFWLVEKVLPEIKKYPISRLVITVSRAEDPPTEKAKRFYADPNRWLQELYPVDEILASELNLPINNIHFELKASSRPVYEIKVFNLSGDLIYNSEFSPAVREIPFLQVSPEWGAVQITTGWCRVKQENEYLLNRTIQTDPERIWGFYQQEILKPLYEFVLKKTNHEPTFVKQPYFKRLLVELWLSEPNYRLGLDEEIISPLESLHDEIYFDTLDFLRGITQPGSEETELPTEASRSSAPGNVLPVLYPATEGQPPQIKFRLEDFPARKPRMTLSWKISGQPEGSKTWEFPALKSKNLKLEEIIFDTRKEQIKKAGLLVEVEKEADYYLLATLLDTYLIQRQKKLSKSAFSYPNIELLGLKIQHQSFALEKTIPVSVYSKKTDSGNKPEFTGEVPLNRIIGSDECLAIAKGLALYPTIRFYLGGQSFEGRPVSVLEIFLPEGRYVSPARLITFKPTLHLTARQHANEVSSTNYSLKFAELLATDESYQPYLKKFNLVIQPLENPDGAELALELFRHQPFHCLHAGRYSAMGVDIGYQVGLTQPLLPEARVRSRIYRDWVPDLYLNLHGYPSHEWVQQFSGYSPYLFRDYWIPRGWFTYYRQLSLKIYEPHRQAAEELKKILIEQMTSDPLLRESNERFYNRYERWARRWSPFVAPLEMYNGLNIYARRQSSTENRLNLRSQMTLVEETPEVMDETATGEWLEFICRQGLTYLKAHARYLSEVRFELERIEEETGNRVRVEFQRGRPGSLK